MQYNEWLQSRASIPESSALPPNPVVVSQSAPSPKREVVECVSHEKAEEDQAKMEVEVPSRKEGGVESVTPVEPVEPAMPVPSGVGEERSSVVGVMGAVAENTSSHHTPEKASPKIAPEQEVQKTPEKPAGQESVAPTVSEECAPRAPSIQPVSTQTPPPSAHHTPEKASESLQPLAQQPTVASSITPALPVVADSTPTQLPPTQPPAQPILTHSTPTQPPTHAAPIQLQQPQLPPTHATPTQPQHPPHPSHLSNLETLLKEEEARLDRLRDDQHRLREGVSSHSTPVSDNQKPEQKREPVRKPNDPVPQTETVPATPLRVKPSAREELSQLKGATEASRISHEERIQVKTQELLQRVEDMKKRNEASKRRKEEKGMTTPSRPLPPQSSEWVVLSASKSVIKMEDLSLPTYVKPKENPSERSFISFISSPTISRVPFKPKENSVPQGTSVERPPMHSEARPVGPRRVLMHPAPEVESASGLPTMTSLRTQTVKKEEKQSKKREKMEGMTVESKEKRAEVESTETPVTKLPSNVQSNHEEVKSEHPPVETKRVEQPPTEPHHSEQPRLNAPEENGKPWYDPSNLPMLLHRQHQLVTRFVLLVALCDG